MGNPSYAIIKYTKLICKMNLMTEKFQRRREKKLIGWHPPPRSWVKLNTDGVFKSNSGMASAGGIIRDEDGRWILRFALNIRPSTSVLAKL